jgi:REP element-mobilizing transposase RayT
VARPPRDRAPGLHHVTVGSAGPIPYYRDDIDRMTWIRDLVRILDRYEWTCVAVCQVTTHLHLLLDIPDTSLPDGMHDLSAGYGRTFNARHERIGNLVRRRYWSKRVTTTEYLLSAFRYIARNPVEAGLCDRAEDWRWSSYATSCGLAQTFPFVDATIVLSQLGSSPAAATFALRTLVAKDE